MPTTAKPKSSKTHTPKAKTAAPTRKTEAPHSSTPEASTVKEEQPNHPGSDKKTDVPAPSATDTTSKPEAHTPPVKSGRKGKASTFPLRVSQLLDTKKITAEEQKTLLTIYSADSHEARKIIRVIERSGKTFTEATTKPAPKA